MLIYDSDSSIIQFPPPTLEVRGPADFHISEFNYNLNRLVCEPSMATVVDNGNDNKALESRF